MSSSFFVVIVYVQFCIILVKWFYKQKIQIIKFGYHFSLYNTHLVYLIIGKKLIRFLPILVMLYVESKILKKIHLFIHRTWCSTWQYGVHPPEIIVVRVDVLNIDGSYFVLWIVYCLMRIQLLTWQTFQSFHVVMMLYSWASVWCGVNTNWMPLPPKPPNYPPKNPQTFENPWQWHC